MVSDCLIYRRVKENFVVYMITSGKETFYTNSFVVETAGAVIAIDAMMTLSEAARVRSVIDDINKPLAAVFITHGHPDHYNGVAVLTEGFGEVPVISSLGVYRNIVNEDDAKEARWRPYFGDDWPDRRVLPNRFVEDGDLVLFDGLAFNIYDLGQAESHSDLCLIVGDWFPVAFVGDVVFGNVHSFMNDGHTKQWLAVLGRLTTLLTRVDLLFVGHGKPGNPQTMISHQKSYIERYRYLVRQLAGGRPSLNAAEKEVLRLRMLDYLSTEDLEVFITAGADAVAAELLAEEAGQVYEE